MDSRTPCTDVVLHENTLELLVHIFGFLGTVTSHRQLCAGCGFSGLVFRVTGGEFTVTGYSSGLRSQVEGSV